MVSPPERDRPVTLLATAGFLGALLLAGCEVPQQQAGQAGRGALPAARDGFVIALLNPKIAVFFLALAIVGVGSMIVQAGLVGRVVSALGERRTMLAGLAFGVVSFLFYGLAPTGGVFLSGIFFGSLFGLMFPALQGRMTRRVDPGEQGRLQGAITSLMGVAGVHRVDGPW